MWVVGEEMCALWMVHRDSLTPTGLLHARHDSRIGKDGCEVMSKFRRGIEEIV